MIKNNKIKTCIIGACIVVSSMSMAFADGNTDATQAVLLRSPDAAVSSENTILTTTQLQQDENSPILQKQKEVDQYLFEQHRGDFAEKGFTVTHTLPLESQVEIGITPYSQENADFLYKELGKDMIKVVEGQQASTMELIATTSIAPDVMNEPKNVSFFSMILEWVKNIFKM